MENVVTISEHGSFMAASLTLNISQPALTRTVQRVEQAIGLEVFRKASSCLPLAKNSVQRFWISWRGGVEIIILGCTELGAGGNSRQQKKAWLRSACSGGSEKGRHARSAVGMSSLPNSVSVEIEAFIELKLTHHALSPRMH